MNYDAMTSGELVAKYNEAATILGQNLVKKFSDKKTAVRRTRKMVEAAEAKQDAEPAPDPAPKPKAKRVVKKRGMRFVYPPKSELRTIRDEDSLRGRVRSALEKGATFEDIVGVVRGFDTDRGSSPGHVERRAYEVIRILNYYIGYGLKQDAEGKIYLYAGE